MNQIILSSFSKDEIRELFSQVVRNEVKKISDQLKPEELISRKEAAEILHISLVTLNKYSKEGVIPCYKIGSRVRYKKQEVFAALESLRKH